MEKKLYEAPQLEVVKIDTVKLLSDSGVESDDEQFDIYYGGTDTGGTVDPQ